MTAPTDAILLGYGGSAHSKIALAWADDLAARLSRPLHVLVSALHVPDVPNVPKEHQMGHVTDELNRLLASAKAPSTSVTTVLTSPGEALVGAADKAHLTVLGARTQGPLKSMVNGSVSQYVTRHAPGPVVVVREPNTARTGRIIVGIDGSEHSLKALEFALRHAKDTSGHVRALHVRQHHDDKTDEKVEQVLARAFEANGGMRVDVEHVLGSAPEKLAEASSEADLLVIGTRGRSAISALLLGSVTQSVLQHSQCPVAVVR
ncbi:universal stress protein [Microbacterium profundi]|uniref:universal stress protein n=1 Tax=Microbacterium profundi TaxID=450380 RepID=UPI001F2A24DC|nr:universal stress protein [Microbacterium profundi]MCE7483577.1 universal stress protein [Microbacterium profundi]